MKDLKTIIKNIKASDSDFLEKAKARTENLVMPKRALGRLHEVSERLCSIHETLKPKTDNRVILIMAGDHGIVEEGISAYPQDVTPAMVKTFLAGGAGINAVSKSVSARVLVVDMGIAENINLADLPDTENFLDRKIANSTKNFAKGPAMTKDQAEKSILNGFNAAGDLFARGCNLLGTGDMGIGNTTPSAAIGMCITGQDADTMVGRGTGVDDRGLERKKAAILKGLEINRPDPFDGLDVLSKVGGFEIGGIAGMILAGAYYRKPVVVDGFISTAGALIAHALCPYVNDYIFCGHVSEEPGHRAMLNHLDQKPLFDLGFRLGEGTGAALAMGIIDAAANLITDVMTFDEAMVSKKE